MPLAIAALVARSAQVACGREPRDAAAAAAATATAFPGVPRDARGPGAPHPRSIPRRRERSAASRRAGRFTDGRRTIVLRWVAAPTRSLHPIAHCYRALGYAIEALPPERRTGSDGGTWGGFRARRSGERLVVRERIEDARGDHFTDVSAWWWEATLGRSQGPWWAVAMAEPEPQGPPTRTTLPETSAHLE